MSPLKALTIMQPHAWAVIHGDKPYENRGWYLHHRGPLLIHAGKGRKWLDEDDDGLPPDEREYPGQPLGRDMAFGAVLGIVDAVGCIRPDRTPRLPDGSLHRTAEGPWCHVYENPRPLLRPIPWPGQQGLWVAPEELTRLVFEQFEMKEVALP